MSSGDRDNIRVLHVDDEPHFTEMVATSLRRENEQFIIKTATSVSEGLDQVAEMEYDCIISDYDLPEQTGLEFLETVRTAYPDIPFILFTAKGSEQVASDAISASVTDYMQKETGSDQYTVLANRITNSVEQYRAAQDAKQTQQRLRELTESTPDCIWMFTSDWEELLFISGYEQVWNRSSEELKENPQGFLDAVFPPDQEQVRQAMRQLSNGKAVDIECRIQRGDESMGWVWMKGTPIVDTTGNVVRVVGFTRDITDRKERERALERTTDRMEFALRGTNAAIWELDPESNAMVCYPEPGPIFEQEFDSGEDFLEVVHSADRSQVETAVQTAIKTGESTSFEFRPISEIEAEWVEAQAKPLKAEDGSVTLLTGLVRDITDRKEHERRLNQLHDATAYLIQADSHDAIAEIAVETIRAILDMPINAIWFHEEIDNTLKLAATTDEGADIFSEPPEFEPGNSLAWQVYQSQEHQVFENVASQDGRYNPETSIRSEIILSLGEHGVLIIGSTEVEQFDETDISLAQIFATTVEAALIRADRHQELARQYERLDEFTSVISHDLRNPLNVASGQLQLARTESDSKHLQEVAAAHERMQTLVENLLTLAREGKSVTDRQPVFLKSIAETCWHTVETETATLITDTEQTIQADQSRLKQLFENLFRNAVEHGGNDVTVTVGDLENGFYVADDGPGIPQNDREDIFERGYSTRDENTGFGLAIVKTIVDAHGWTIHITDSADGGAQFEITSVTTNSG